jgi:hypothetical protein
MPNGGAGRDSRPDLRRLFSHRFFIPFFIVNNR